MVKKPYNVNMETPTLDISAVLASMPGHVYWKDINGAYLGCNDLQAKDAGLSSRFDIVGKDDYDMPWSNLADLIRANDQRVMELGVPITFEEGRFISRKAPLRDNSGSIIGMQGVSIDISEYNLRIQKELHTLEEIVAVLPGHVYWKDRNCILQGCNNEQAADVGLASRLDIVGKTAYDILWQGQSEEDKKQQAAITNSIDDDIMNTNEAKTLEEFVMLPDGEMAYYLSKKVPLHDFNDNVAGLVGISFDITDRKKAEKELKEAKERAEAASRAKTEFIRNIEHDVRTPLSGIWGMMHLLAQENNYDEEQKETFNELASSARELLDFFNGILDYSKIEANVLPVTSRSFDFHELIHGTIDMEIPAAKLKQLDLQLEIHANMPQMIIADRYRIQRILINLLSNAIKFTDSGFVKLSARVAKTLPGRNIILQIIVSDSGMGIPEDKQESIYERFTRIVPSNKGLFKGQGLGLCIVKQFVEELDGDVHLQSKLNVGSTFTVDLPVKVPLLSNPRENNHGR